ncbi:hypothetical protein KIN20_005930 [Parelaphostrongylus tenuis]|uniref:Uncharacterized protein n=1 Tax=Parelaphostrongylus tenuis TaxID=148309 RepID=A0AAD5MJM2_PARTN|nr:hypothetical protein KIN20_005930 [Parelaphostrongylus tenuis]
MKSQWCNDENIRTGWTLDYEELLARVPWLFTEYAKQHEGGTRRKKESSVAAFLPLEEVTNQLGP